MRVGFGYSLNPIEEGRSLILGGITIPFGNGEKKSNHSDSVLNAVADALLGAAGLGDIDDFVQEIEHKMKDDNNFDLLREIDKKVNFEKFKISNIDITLISQKIFVSEYKQQIKNNLVDSLFLNPNQVNIKINTYENNEFAANQNSIVCHAVALLIPK